MAVAAKAVQRAGITDSIAAFTATNPIQQFGATGNNIPNNIKTPLCRSAFIHFMAEHPDRKFVRFISDVLLYGADIGYRGPKYTRTTPNSFSARQHSEILQKQILFEVKLHHSAGPFTLPFF